MKRTLLNEAHRALLRARKLHAEIGGLNPAAMLDADYNRKVAELGMLPRI